MLQRLSINQKKKSKHFIQRSRNLSVNKVIIITTLVLLLKLRVLAIFA